MHPLTRLHWETTLYQRLTQVIKDNAQPLAVDPSQCGYMVFDFDETCITGDIEDSFMTYLVDHLAFKLNPDQFKEVLTCQPDLLTLPLEKDRGSLKDLVNDILSAYQVLWDQGLVGQVQMDTQDLHYQAFASKLVYYYFTVMKHLNFRPHQAIPTYFFTGFSQEEMNQQVHAMLNDDRYRVRQARHWITPEEVSGKTGVLAVTHQAGIIFPAEMVDLFQTLMTQGICPYIVSASPLPLVQAVVAQSPFHDLNPHQIYAMQAQFDSKGQILNQLDPQVRTSHGPGKSRIIRDQIAPRHQGRSPLAIFGDSMGDYDMLTSFDHTHTRVLFNRHLNDQTQDLAKEAAKTYGQAQARFFLQGKDYHTGQFLNQTHSRLISD